MEKRDGFVRFYAMQSIIFGAAHLNTHSISSNIGWTFVFATLAGVFYARTFLATRNAASAGVVHAAVNWAGWLLFGGLSG